MIRVEIADRQRCLKLSRQRLRAVTEAVLHAEGVEDAEISVALVTDDGIAEINEKYLRHQGPTDVISFPYTEPAERPLSGEIILSTETAVREAERRRHGAEEEATLYLIHGLLHLCGHDDHEPADRRKMRRREKVYLNKLGIQLK